MSARQASAARSGWRGARMSLNSGLMDLAWRYPARTASSSTGCVLPATKRGASFQPNRRRRSSVSAAADGTSPRSYLQLPVTRTRSRGTPRARKRSASGSLCAPTASRQASTGARIRVSGRRTVVRPVRRALTSAGRSPERAASRMSVGHSSVSASTRRSGLSAPSRRDTQGHASTGANWAQATEGRRRAASRPAAVMVVRKIAGAPGRAACSSRRGASPPTSPADAA